MMHLLEKDQHNLGKRAISVPLVDENLEAVRM
jgi:hypothetical protein